MRLTNPTLVGIRIFPVKSLDALELREVEVLPSGGLAQDREFALTDNDGKFINAKRFPLVQRLRSAWDRESRVLCLQWEGGAQEKRFRLPHDQSSLEAWLSQYFEQPVVLAQNLEGGFPDDSKAPGPTVISTATLEEVASWYPGLTLEETRRRFRANLEIGGVPAFWEDQLYADAGEAVPFRIGEVTFHGVNPCQRCIVPTRDSHSADPTSEFSQTFRAMREATLPPWANRSRFNHFYRLAINTCVPATEAGKILSLGDPLTLLPIG